MSETTLEQAIECLERSGNYQLIKRYEKPAFYHPDDGTPKLKGVFLDVETTGLSISDDKIIELGLVVFEYSENGRIFKIVEEFSQYQDPGKPIPPEITQLTGITDQMVSGHCLDKKTIFNALNEASLIVAHYATFDRGCLEAQWKDIPLKPWACSMAEIPWRQEGIESAKLEYLAYRYQFFYEGHRAIADCLAGVHLLAQKLPLSKKPVLKSLLEKNQQPTFRLWALNAPIKNKDILKNRRYRWNPEGRHKAWVIDLLSNQVLEEIKFLWQTVYDYQAPIPIEVIYATNRYSTMANLDQY